MVPKGFGRWRKATKDAFYRPPRRERVDATRMISIRKDDSGFWMVIDGFGTVLRQACQATKVRWNG